MYYVCIEDLKIVSILNYEPSVPSSVLVIPISDEDYEGIKDQTKYFDVTSQQVVVSPNSLLEKKEQDQKNAVHREFLNSTDWMILRHLRQKYLEISTSLSEEEFKNLEQQRHEAALKIVE
jgi:hypothetical protein